MAYELIQNGQKQFAVDWDVVRRLVRSYYTSCWQLDLGREVTLSESAWYNPFSWSLPAVDHIEVDWDQVRQRADADTADEVRQMRQRAAHDATSVAKTLDQMIDLTARQKEDFADWMGLVQTRNTQSIAKAVEDYEANVEISRFVRDASADGLMIGASVMTGGAAVAAIGGGSFFKGTCKFQDSGSIGAAAMEGVGSFAFAYVKLGKRFSFKEEMVLALVQAPYKAGTELVAGSTVSKAALSGGVKLTGPAVDRLLKIGPARTLFDKVAVPLVVSYDGQNVAATLLSKAAAKSVEHGIKSRLGGPAPAATDRAPEAARGGQLLGDTTLSNKFLLYLAFVNMQNGIGRGW